MNGMTVQDVITAIIAGLLIIGSLTVTVMSLYRPIPGGIPAWMTTATTLVIGYYFGRHGSGSGNGGGKSAGT